jgi:DNA-binding response OmpR family regulator
MKRGKRILIVDDDAAHADILRRLLSKDYVVATASTGHECLARLADFRPQVVLLDVMMPGMDGHETCRRIKLSPLGGMVRVVLSSAGETLIDQVRGAHALADDYLVKPLDHAVILAKVRAQFDAMNRETEEESSDDAEAAEPAKRLTPSQRARFARALQRRTASAAAFAYECEEAAT